MGMWDRVTGRVPVSPAPAGAGQLPDVPQRCAGCHSTDVALTVMDIGANFDPVPACADEVACGRRAKANRVGFYADGGGL